jgi:DNA topoisomerase IB
VTSTRPDSARRQPALREVDCNGPGITRRRAGRGFTYRNEGGERITDDEVIARIKALAIPPAWTDVWICTDAGGHIQATGVDAKGRRQYLYHETWRERRDREKFDRMLELARALPRLRSRLERDLSGAGMGRDRVLACAVRLLQVGLFRVGGEAYVEDNGSYGLATVRKGHVRASGDELRFDYPSKSGKRRVVTIADEQVSDIVRALKGRRGGGPDLLAYKDERGRWVDVTSTDINEYLQDALGPDFSAKDFRTWTATVVAAVALASEEADEDAARRERERAVGRVVKGVAQQLGNTPAVARSSYVDPRVIERFADGQTIADAVAGEVADDIVGDLTDDGDDADDDVVLEAVPSDVLAEVEAAVVELIEKAPRRVARRRRR